MIIDFIIEDLMLNSYLQKNFHTLFKYEEAYLTLYNNIKEARSAIGRYVHTYNFERCHSALDYKTPAECYYPAMLLPYVA